MRLSLRFIVPLLVTLAAFAYALVRLVDKPTIQWFVRDLDLRANLIGNTVQEPLHQLLDNGNKTRITQFLTRLTLDERLHSVGYCTAQGKAVASTPLFPKEVERDKLEVHATPAGCQLQTAKDRWHIAVASITPGRAIDSMPSAMATGWLVLVHDMSFVDRRTAETREWGNFVQTYSMVGLITCAIRLSQSWDHAF